LFNIYPNPGNGILNVTLNLEGVKKAGIIIYDANGKVVYTGNNDDSIDNKMQIDLRNQASGLYFMKVITDGYTTAKSFSIQK
jgi:hypothetical protein